MNLTTDSVKPARVVRLIVEDVKMIERADLELPDSTTIVVSGPNGSGKSSLLDSFAMLLGGKRKFGAEPIRRGAMKATIIAHIADDEPLFTVKRTITAGNSTLDITKANGEKWKGRKQDALDELFSPFCLDPVEFSQLTPGEQVKGLILAYHPDFDLDDIESKKKDANLNRRNANREADRLTKQMSALTAPTADEPREKQDFTKLNDRLNAVCEAQRQFLTCQRNIGDHEKERASVQKRIDDDTARLAQIDRAVNSLRTRHDSIVIEDDPDELRATINDIVTINARVTEIEDYEHKAEALAQWTKNAKDYDQQMDDLDKQVTDAIADIKMPLDEMTVTANGIRVGEFALEQLNSSAQILACTALACHWPVDVGLVRVKHGNDLDPDTMKKMADLAAETGCQLFIERIVSDVGIVMQEGKVIRQT